MNIEIRNKGLAFMELAIGDGFIYGNNVFIKINPFNDNEYGEFNAISLMNGDSVYFDNEEIVSRVNKMIVQ